ncbi:MAG: bifunctional hydroxymethylpyrimidine kinase/phosphomethylpyrimidine kinase [Firmicutes bacterium]|nr:bifunctional hydroxymethylpyrimidine kinase/phosphomethylpyrimidine kinase [Bacillota bacterium]
MSSIPRAMTIAGSDSGGGAGIQADLKTFTVLGVYGTSVIVALTAQNTLGVTGIHAVPPEFAEAQLVAVLEDIGTDALKTGMLANAEIVRVVARVLRRHRESQKGLANLVVDPVMVSKSGHALLEREACTALRSDLLPLAMVVTPNLFEAEVLTGERVGDMDEMRRAAALIHGMGPRYVVVKGGHLGGPAVDLMFDGNGFVEFRHDRIETRNTHGTGCTYSAAIAAFLARGLEPVEAVREAKEYVTAAIRGALDIGGGHGPTNHMAWKEWGRGPCR